MRIFVYSLQTAFKSLWHEKWIYFLTILSISIALLILSAFVTVTLNLDFILKRWSKSFGLVVYLKENVTREAEDTLKEFFLNDFDIVDVKYISKKQAAVELRSILGPKAPILEELKENPLPSSFELKLKRDLLEPSLVKQKAEQIKRMAGIEEIQYGEKWLSSLNTISKTMKISATILGCAIFIAIVFITYNTIKIFFYRRREEIETLKLLGATRSFIRFPFLLEGLFIGILGGIIGSLALYGIYSLISFEGIASIYLIRAIMISLPIQLYIFIPIAGAVMSFIGSFIAVGRIRY